jgi:hypothetical protein
MTQLADMTDKTAVVTGATSGIGRVGAIRLGQAGARVIVHGRNRTAGEETVRRVEAAGGTASFEAADFADLREVRELARRVRETTGDIDVLCNNAGLTALTHEVSEQGYELHIAVNHLAPYLLTHELAPELAPDARIVTTSSNLHRLGRIDLHHLERKSRADTHERTRSGPRSGESRSGLSRLHRLAQVSNLSGFLAYCTSKLANLLFTRELARRLSGERTANCFHPGIIPQTGIERGIPFPLSVGWNGLEFVPGVTSTIADGGEALAYLAASSDIAGMTIRSRLTRKRSKNASR